MPRSIRPAWLSSTTLKLIVFLIVLLVSTSVGFYYLELIPRGEHDFLSAVWWTVVTLTTVGYGDLVPLTPVGRALGIVVMVTGIGMVATLTGNFASFLVEQRTKKRKGLLKVTLDNHFLILGWNDYGPSLIASMKERGCFDSGDLVLINSLSQEQREELSHQLDLGVQLHYVSGNPAQESVVNRSSPATARLAFILSQAGIPPEEADQLAIYAALTLRSQAPKLTIVAEVVRQENREHVLRAGVNEVLVRGEIATGLMGLMGQSPAAYHFLRNLVGTSDDHCLQYRALTRDERHMTWGELFDSMRQRQGILPLAVCQDAKSISLNDILAEGSPLDDFIKDLFQSSGRRTPHGTRQPAVTINPRNESALSSYDGVIYLETSKVV